MAAFQPLPLVVGTDDAGFPLVGGKIFTYESGTVTLKTTFTDTAQTIQNTNPIVLNARGEALMVLGAGAYTLQVCRADNSIVRTVNGVVDDTAALSLTTTASINAVSSNLAASGGSGLVGFNPTGIGATPTTVQSALNVLNQKKTNQEWVENGAKVQRIADRLFVGDAIVCDGRAVPLVGTWIKGVQGGVFGYLESTATLVAPATARGIGIFGGARTSTQSGAAGEAAIGIAGFAYNDFLAGANGAWGFYSTVIHRSGSTGPTHGMEIDIANFGATSAALPNSPNPVGLTNGIRVCTGGEALGAGTASYAIGIVQNDGAAVPTAKFEKGILFHSKAISGTDGATGTGIAIAFAKGHTMAWYNNAGNQTSFIYSAVTTPTVGQGILFSDEGTRIVNTSDNSIQMLALASIGSVNYPTTRATGTGTAVKFGAMGGDANIDVYLDPKGGVFGVTYGSSVATTPANFVASRRLAFKDGNNIQWFLPISTVAW